MNKNLNWWLVKIDRIFAWILLVSMFLYFLTGYGMTKGIINSGFATKLHLDILPLVFIIAFVIHTGLAVRLAFMRWRVWNKASMAILILIYLSFLIGFGYIELFYQKPKAESKQENKQEQTVDKNKEEETKTEQPSGEKTFTVSELSQYNGQNGNSAYVAVDGVVYDVTSVFTQGKHYTHYAGQELTNAFYTRHAISSITKYPVIGKLQ